ncbi:hypothetical protein FACS1894125_6510 [Actinomycetota bacterium]|nr:hypothetical protein FACS1894125_6510 [Actinomycetota bacterium]
MLNDVAKNIGGFEGNAQTFRILVKLEPKVYVNGQRGGLNLIRATLDAVIKYPWGSAEAAEKGTTKFNVYDDDLDVYDFVRKYTPSLKSRSKCIEAQIMDLADDISYSTHDIEDALVSGAFDRLTKAGVINFVYDKSYESAAKLKNFASSLIGRFINLTINETMISGISNTSFVRYSSSLVVPKVVLDEIKLLMAFSAAFVMMPRNEGNEHIVERETIESLVDFYSNPTNLDPQFNQLINNATTDDDYLRIVVDQIACLTDFSAKAFTSLL